MCDDDIGKGVYKNLKECTQADDYGEAASEGCYGKGFLAKVVKEYNEENRTKVFCDPDLR